MIYLTTYQALKAINEERVKRSLARTTPIDGFVTRETETVADIIEVSFGVDCELPAIGA